MEKQAHPPAMIDTPTPLAKRVIGAFSLIVFAAVLVLNRVQVPAPAGWDIHFFAKVNAVLNTCVSVLLLAGLFSARTGRYALHRKIMLSAMALSVLFLVSYITHHLFAGDTPYGGQGGLRVAYYVILISHILLAATSLPFILFTAYRALSAHYPAHRELARKVWPVWFYVSLSGVVVYLMISPYY